MPRSRTDSPARGETGMLPLSALLSQAYVAFTIEFDNEFEHQVPHRTTNHGHTPGHPRAPWLVSMAMWNNYLQYVPEEGIAAGELQRLLGISNKGLKVWLTRLGNWWSYLRLEPPLTEKPARVAPETRITPTAGGLAALRAWRPLTALIEKRWRGRFGAETAEGLRDALRAIVAQLPRETPDFFAVLEYDPPRRRRLAPEVPLDEMPLPRLLAKVLVALADEYEQQSPVPIAVRANLLRVIGDEGVRLRDLPALTHLSAEGVAAAIRMTERGRLAAVGNEAGPGRAKVVRLTETGIRARERYAVLTAQIEQSWRERFGEATLHALRSRLEELALPDASGSAPLLRGVVPYPDGWRASLPPLTGLPHFPMVSHRGGFPDGS